MEQARLTQEENARQKKEAEALAENPQGELNRTADNGDAEQIEKLHVAKPIILEREKFVIHVQTESKLEYIKTKQKPLL